MLWINQLDENTINQYSKFTRECKSLIKEIVRNSDYDQLSPSNITRKEDMRISRYKTKVNIIGRPNGLPKQGFRNLNVGGLETVVIVQGVFNDKTNYGEGINISEASPGIRFVIGPHLSTYNDIVNYINSALKSEYQNISTNLNNGDYRSFVNNILFITNYALYEFKKNKRLLP